MKSSMTIGIPETFTVAGQATFAGNRNSRDAFALVIYGTAVSVDARFPADHLPADRVPSCWDKHKPRIGHEQPNCS
jgi:hypothetical protein